MNLVQLLKLCVFAAFTVSLITGVLFMMRSSEEDEIRIHAKDIYGKLAENQRAEQKAVPIKQKLPVEGLPPAPAHPRPPTIEKVREHSGHMGADTEKSGDNPKAEAKPKEANADGKPHPLISPEQAAAGKAVSKSTGPSAEIKKALQQAPARQSSIHIFYYPWYGTPRFNNGSYLHWNHHYLKPWDAKDKHIYPEGRHQPPKDIASSFYPALGPYSSMDPEVVDKHMKWLSSSGVDVVVASWFPSGMSDAEGAPYDALLIPMLMNATQKYKMQMAFHLEPYEGRTVDKVHADIKYLVSEYGHHPALYRTRGKKEQSSGKDAGGAKAELPLFYIYDSYRIAPSEWQRITTTQGDLSIRHTEWDALLIGLLLEKGDGEASIKGAGFDGLYTYFAADGFTSASAMVNWPEISVFCAKEDLIFAPSLGPGYNDTSIRPWNSATLRGRSNGDYYRAHWRAAKAARADIVSITSFNEWHEGTQIEPAAAEFPSSLGDDAAKAKAGKNSKAPPQSAFNYEHYEGGPEQYLKLTLELVKELFTPPHHDIEEKIARIV